MSLKHWIVPVASGFWVAIFSNYAFAPYSHAGLVWLAPWGLFILERHYRGQYKKLLWSGFWVAIVFYSFSFTWILHMMVVFGGFPYVLAVPLFFLSAIILNLWFPFFLVGFSWLGKRLGKNFAWIAGFVCVLGEFTTPQIFPWYWGSVVAGHNILAQTAEYFSIYGLSFLLFVLSYASFSWFGRDFLGFLYGQIPWRMGRAYWNRKFRLAKIQWVYGILLVFFLGLGGFLYQKWIRVEPTRQLDVLVVQPNAPLEFRDGRSVAETMRELLNRIETLSLMGSASSPDPVDLVVFPESGVPFFSTHKHTATTASNIYWEQFDSFVHILAHKLNASIFYNELDASFAGKEMSRRNLRFYNSSTVVNPNGERMSSYQKVFLLIGGEYMPFEFLYELSPQTGRFEAGTQFSLQPVMRSTHREPHPRHLVFEDTYRLSRGAVGDYYQNHKTAIEEVGKFLPLICYEVIIPEFVREFRKSGNPDFIVNVTNDKWYGVSAETFQHGDLARIRSIEWRKWMVRSTNSGSSFFVDHLGRVVDGEFTGQESAEFIRKKIDLIPSEPTFYVLYGNLLVWLGLGGFALWFSFLYIAKSRRISR